MKLFFKVIILFMIVFNFRISYVYNSVVLADILVLFYYFFLRKSVPFTYFNLRYNVVIFIGTAILILVNIAFTVFHGKYDFLGVKRFVLEFFVLVSFVFILPIFIEGEENVAYEKILLIICYTFALQGFIHLLGYFYKPIGEFIYSTKPAGFRAYVENPAYGIDKFRGYALAGSVFFELPAAYGVAAIAFFRLQLMKGQKYLTGLKAYIVFFLIIAGISLSGRTGFVGVFMGLFLYSLFSLNRISEWIKNGWKIILAVIFALGFFYLLLTPRQRASLTDQVFPFAFEAYYNWRDKGTFSTSSTDALMQIHYYPLRDETLLLGHGEQAGPDNNYHPTDAGYMNTLIYGGIFYLLCLIIYQYFYFATPLYLNKRRESREKQHDFVFYILLFVYILILESKAGSIGTQYLTEVLYLALGSTFAIEYYYQLEHG